MWWELEEGYDFAYAVASVDGETWTILEGDSSTPSDGGSSFGPGYTGISNGWQTEHFDLTPFAGAEVYVRFEYVTDDAINGRGLFLNEVAIPAIGYTSDFSQGADGWESEGWIFTNNQLRQDWILQLLTLEDDNLVSVEAIEVDEQGRASMQVAGLGGGRTAVIAISGAAPITIGSASYTYWIDRP
jgi:hypothetical protein